MSKVRSEPAPTTWMIEAHSAFFSMSPTEASDVEDLAADRQQRLELGVAGELRGAERGVTLDDEPLALLHVVGAAVGQLRRERARLSAFFRRWVSLCWRAAIRVREAATTFSMTSLACAFSARLVE